MGGRQLLYILLKNQCKSVFICVRLQFLCAYTIFLFSCQSLKRGISKKGNTSPPRARRTQRKRVNPPYKRGIERVVFFLGYPRSPFTRGQVSRGQVYNPHPPPLSPSGGGQGEEGGFFVCHPPKPAQIKWKFLYNELITTPQSPPSQGGDQGHRC